MGEAPSEVARALAEQHTLVTETEKLPTKAEDLGIESTITVILPLSSLLFGGRGRVVRAHL